MEEKYDRYDPGEMYIIKKNNFNWVYERRVTEADLEDLEDTRNNDNAFKRTMLSIMEEIDDALRMGNKKYFEDLCREYRGMKMECVR